MEGGIEAVDKDAIEVVDEKEEPLGICKDVADGICDVVECVEVELETSVWFVEADVCDMAVPDGDTELITASLVPPIPEAVIELIVVNALESLCEPTNGRESRTTKSSRCSRMLDLLPCSAIDVSS